jgi:hypothetical protein
MSNRLQFIGMHVTRYGLVLVLLWIGGMKFTAYEAEGIRPLVANSPLMGWVYNLMSVTAFSSLLGVVEIAIGVGPGQWVGGGDVPDHPQLPGDDARMGAESRRVPGRIGDAGAVCAQRHRAVGCRAVDGRRGMGSAAGSDRRIRRIRRLLSNRTWKLLCRNQFHT